MPSLPPSPSLLDEHQRMVEEGVREREYGTFEVAVIDSETKRPDEEGNTAKAPFSHGKRSRRRDLGSVVVSDCCFFMALVCAPVRLQTYRILLFHLTNFVFACVAAVWMLLLLMATLVAQCSASLTTGVRDIVSKSLRRVVDVETILLNFILPNKVAVCSSWTNFQQENGIYALLYFMVIKLVLCAIPGFIAAVMFLLSTLRFAEVILTAVMGIATSHLNDADIDIQLVLTALAVYSSVLLLQVMVFMCRHVTFYFCGQYLLQSS